MYYIGVRDGKKRKKKLEKEGINTSQHPAFHPQYAWPLSRRIQKLKALALIGAEKSVRENSVGEKEKWKNKGKCKQVEAVSLLHNITGHTKDLYQISKF